LEEKTLRKIQITSGDVSVTATLADNPIADMVWQALPIEARANTWGDEIYFGIPVMIEESENARDVLEMGALAYWPPGNAFCIFFGRTPASRGNEIRAASAVNPIGRVIGDPTILKQVENGAPIHVEAIRKS
jgi:uncharacterized protein